MHQSPTSMPTGGRDADGVYDERIQEQVDLIREVFIYAQRFKNASFVIQIGSFIMDHPVFANLVNDLVILHRAGIRIVLVPGAGKRIDQILDSYGVPTTKVNSVRISTPDAMPLIKMAAFDVANKLMTQLSSHNVDSVIGNWVRARSLGVHDGVDYQDAGSVERVNMRLINKVLDDDLVPILPCIGWSAAGRPYNVSSRELSTYLSVQLNAEKLFFVTDSEELHTDRFQVPPGDVAFKPPRISRLTTAAAEQFLALNKDEAGSVEYELVRLSAQATREGVERAHILDGRIDGVLLKEIFSTLGFGTMIHRSPFESIRPMIVADIPEVLRIMEPAVARGVLIPRGERDLETLYKDFVVYETDGNVRGCGALHDWGEQMAEIAAIAVDTRYAHLKIGRKLVDFLIQRAKTGGMRRVFVLTTQTSDWFQTIGFAPAMLGDLPRRKQAAYDRSRNSRILMRDVDFDPAVGR